MTTVIHMQIEVHDKLNFRDELYKFNKLKKALL